MKEKKLPWSKETDLGPLVPGVPAKNIRLEVTSKIIKGKMEFFMTRKYEDSNIEDETVPMNFHTKNYKKGDPFKLYKEEQKKKKDKKNEEALNKSVEMKDEEDSDN